MLYNIIIIIRPLMKGDKCLKTKIKEQIQTVAVYVV